MGIVILRVIDPLLETGLRTCLCKLFWANVQADQCGIEQFDKLHPKRVPLLVVGLESLNLSPASSG